MGRHTAIELAWLAGGLLMTLAVTAAAAWAYSPGAEAIWTTGGIAAVVVIAINLAPIRAAARRDRAGD